jgi:hypothetical protein
LLATLELLQNVEARQRLLEIEDEERRGGLQFVSSEEAERRLLA